MGGLFGSQTPPAPTPPPPAANPPTAANGSSASVGSAAKARAAAAAGAGYDSTLLTGAQGAAAPNTAGAAGGKNLTGQ